MTTFPMPTNQADHVLVASPNVVVRQRVLDSLLPQVRFVEQATGGAEALVHLESGFWQILFLDRRLPDLDAEELSRTVRQRFPAVEVVMLEDASNPAESQPASPSLVRPVVHIESEENSDQRGDKSNVNTYDIAEYSEPHKPSTVACPTLPGMIGQSAAIQSVYRVVHLVAPRDITVLITGPTGSGKELVARALHQLSSRADHNFAVINCAAIPETMLEAELFGYSRGAFTGALQSYAGRIQAAHLGTLFLDEIGEMPLSLQPKLLRFLEQKELQRLGSSQVVRVDARVVSATNVDLLGLVREGKFREDLYYRLSAFPLAIPPLRERPDDVAQLVVHFLKKFSSCWPTPVISDEARELLQSQGWPGNVRELQNVIERALILATGQSAIRPEHLIISGRSARVRSSSERQDAFIRVPQ